MLIQSGKQFYYHAFFDGVQNFSSVQEAAQWIKHAVDNPKNLGLYR
jgi:hypothetical protein